MDLLYEFLEMNHYLKNWIHTYKADSNGYVRTFVSFLDKISRLELIKLCIISRIFSKSFLLLT